MLLAGCSGILDLFDVQEMVVVVPLESEAVALSGLPGVPANYRMIKGLLHARRFNKPSLFCNYFLLQTL